MLPQPMRAAVLDICSLQSENYGLWVLAPLRALNRIRDSASLAVHKLLAERRPSCRALSHSIDTPLT